MTVLGAEKVPYTDINSTQRVGNAGPSQSGPVLAGRGHGATRSENSGWWYSLWKAAGRQNEGEEGKKLRWDGVGLAEILNFCWVFWSDTGSHISQALTSHEM